MPIGTKVGNIKNLKDSLKRGSGGSFIKYIPKDSSLTVRFLEDPENWVNYWEHFDSTLRKSYPCIDDNCPGCATGENKSSRYLANAVDVDNDRVIPLQLPKTLVSSLVALYERMDTLLDRDFELVRSGEGLDTTYNVVPEAPLKRKLTKYQLHDLQQILDESFQSVFGAAPEEAEVPKKAVMPRKKSKAAKIADPVFTPDDDEDEDVEEDVDPDVDEDEAVDVAVETPMVEAVDVDEDVDDDGDFFSEDDLNEKTLGELRAIAKDYGIPTKGLNRVQIIEAILTPEEDDD